MVAVVAGSVHREVFFEVLRAFGFNIEESADHIVISRDKPEPPFLEVWPIPEDQTFIFKRHVMRCSRRMKIPVHLFWNPAELQKFVNKLSS